MHHLRGKISATVPNVIAMNKKKTKKMFNYIKV